MTNCADIARRPDEQRLVEVASILAAGILRLRDRLSLPVAKHAKKPGDSYLDRLELSGETGAKHQDILEFMFEFSTRDTFGRASGVIRPPNSLNQTLKAV
jgi:hypothetical protein